MTTNKTNAIWVDSDTFNNLVKNKQSSNASIQFYDLISLYENDSINRMIIVIKNLVDNSLYGAEVYYHKSNKQITTIRLDDKNNKVLMSRVIKNYQYI